MKKSIIKTIIIYLLFICIALFLYKLNIFDKYKTIIISLFNLLIIKDILIHFYEKKEIQTIKNDKKKLFNDYNKKKISSFYLISFLNRNYFFSIILVIYLIYLLIWQTHIFWLDKITLFKLINQNILLWVTIFSWILTISNEKQDKNYQIIEKNTKSINKSIILTIFLSTLWTYIILDQTIKLWLLSYAISIISWILIFLIWMSILDDEEKIK